MANQSPNDKKPGGGDVTKAEKRTPKVEKTTWESVGNHTGPMTSDDVYDE